MTNSRNVQDVLQGPATTAFAELVRHYSYQQGPRPASRPLTHFTFWVGAGFSKSWDPKAPLGSKLFKLKTETIEKVANTLVLFRMFGLDSFKGVTDRQLRQIVYQLDMYERFPEIRPRYVDEQNLRFFKAALLSAVTQRYQEITTLNFFDSGTQKSPCTNPTTNQKSILNFFEYIFDRVDGSEPQVEGVRTHFITTNYDFVVETILDNILAPDDSLFISTYRGFTPSHIAGQRNPTPVLQHWLSWHLLKINGGFEILERNGKYDLNYEQRPEEDILDRPPTLMLPSREQNYSDVYFRTIFPKAIRLLRDTTVLVLVGYSFPRDDALIRFILRQFAEEPEDGRGKWVFYIDPNSRKNKRKAVGDVFPSIKTGEADFPYVLYFDGTFSDFTKECLEEFE